MPLLYYWKRENYRADQGTGLCFAYHLNRASPRLHDIDLGDSLWAFTRNEADEYVLAAELVVSHKTRNPRGFQYGPYRVWGDVGRSRYFRVEGQASAESLIRALSVAPRAERLGQGFQGHAGVKTLSTQDHQLLTAHAAVLAVERPRVTAQDELRAELQGQAPFGLAREGRASTPSRQRSLVLELRRLYSGRCQVCQWEARPTYGADVCEGHHHVWLSRGGPDELGNLVLVCPNHHRAIHAADAPLDFSDLAFVFPEHREVLRLNEHLGR